MIQVFSNSLGENELQGVARAFESRWVGKGPEHDALERELAAFWRVANPAHVLLFNCATSAIYVALRTLGIGPGDEVIIPSVHFVACAGAVLERRATPVFADVDAHTLNVLPSEVERLRRKTRGVRAVIVNHYGGHPCDLEAVRDALPPGAFLIEDAANAVASTYHGIACGTVGDVGVWSFDAMKELVMGDGGALFCASLPNAERARRLRYLGLLEATTSGAAAAGAGRDRWWAYDVVEPSGRFISNDILAAIGRVQLQRLPGFIARRREVWEFYQKHLAGVGDLRLPLEPPAGCTTSYYLYWIQTARRDDLARHLLERGIYTTFRYYPLHLVQRFGGGERLPSAERAAAVTLNLPLHQNLSEGDLWQIVAAVKEFYG
ncbi:MAG: DegT/DnrJ/EryC1/StrS family aminotransferase [Gammaproteobacteria bacterium]|nr:DegT/DnrJ/EryC1/StrS family aminotransferase [Gammaproteobacteria bacterium]